MNFEVLEDIGFISAVVGGVVLGLYQAYIRIKKVLDTNKHKNSYRFKVEAKQCLNQLAKDAKADRAILFKSEDSGGIPVLGVDIYTSIVMVSDDFSSDKERDMGRDVWHKERGDSFQEYIIHQIIQSRFLMYSIKDVPAKCKHYDLYLQFNVDKVIISLVDVIPTSLYYLVLHFGKEKVSLGGLERNIMRTGVAKLKKML